MNIENEIKDLAVEIQLRDCYGCNYKEQSLNFHTCKDDYYYNLAYLEAYALIKSKYIDKPGNQEFFERFNFGLQWHKLW